MCFTNQNKTKKKGGSFSSVRNKNCQNFARWNGTEYDCPGSGGVPGISFSYSCYFFLLFMFFLFLKELLIN